MTIHLEITIAAPLPKVFATLVDLESYPAWLPQSTVFKGTTQVSSSPVKLGTTYLEPGPAGLRKGEVVEFEAPWKVTFHQPMSLKPYFLGLVIDVQVKMVLREEEGMTVLERDVLLEYPSFLWPFKTVIDREFKRESWRFIELLKRHVEGSKV
jgi:uncharacterized protein YndB with AHSA1/START domain